MRTFYRGARGRGRGFRGGSSRETPSSSTPSTPPSTPPSTLLGPACPLIVEDPLISAPNEPDSSHGTPLDTGASCTRTSTTDQDSPSQPRKPRGEYLMKKIPANPSDCKVIRISGDHYLDKDVARTITKIFKGNFYGKQSQWLKLDTELKDHLYKCFQDRYQHDEQVHPSKARDVWEDKSKELCRGLWNGIRGNCMTETGSDNPANWKRCCPEFIYQDDWEALLELWMTPEWKKRSIVGSQNRKSVPGDDTSVYVRHTGGSLNFEIHRHQLEIELGRPPTQVELFERVHKRDKGKGEWCDAKAEKVAAKYHHAVKRKRTAELEIDSDEIIDDEMADDVDPPPEVPFDPEAWADAIGVPKKKHAYGHSQASSSMQPVFQNSTSVNEDDVIELKEKNASLEKRVEELMSSQEKILSLLRSHNIIPSSE